MFFVLNSDRFFRRSRFGIIVAVTGASGSIYGLRLLEKLRSIPPSSCICW